MALMGFVLIRRNVTANKHHNHVSSSHAAFYEGGDSVSRADIYNSSSMAKVNIQGFLQFQSLLQP